MTSRAVFLDRDGVINRKAPGDGYITRWQDFHFLPGVAKAIAMLNRAGYRVIVVTNQRCVAKGLLSLEQLEVLHDRMLRRLANAGAKVDDVLHCPHDIDLSCDCRKPQPGMLMEAARRNNIDLSSSWMIGDSDKDVHAGKSAGCKTARVARTNHRAGAMATITASSLTAAVRQILLRDKGALKPERKTRRKPNVSTRAVPSACK